MVAGVVKERLVIEALLSLNSRFRTKVNEAPERFGEKGVSVVRLVALAIAVMVLVWPEAVIESPTKSVVVNKVPTPVTVVVPEVESVPVPAWAGEPMGGEKGVSMVRLVALAIAVMNLVWPAAMIMSPTLKPRNAVLVPVTVVPTLWIVPDCTAEVVEQFKAPPSVIVPLAVTEGVAPVVMSGSQFWLVAEVSAFQTAGAKSTSLKVNPWKMRMVSSPPEPGVEAPSCTNTVPFCPGAAVSGPAPPSTVNSPAASGSVVEP